jgi:hypothetical protein
MGTMLTNAVHLGTTLALASARAPWWADNEEAPPHTFALWLGIGLGFAVVALVALGIHLHRRHGLRAASVLPDDPFAVDAMEAAMEIFCALDPAWTRRDEPALGRLAPRALVDRWRPALATSSADDLLVEGPLEFEYMGAAAPSPGADRRAIVRVEGRLHAPTKQVSISPTQRRWLLGLAAGILIVAFVGIAVAPATKIRNSRPTTIVVRGGVPSQGVRLLTYRRGAPINVTVRSDVPDEVYLQGYNIYEPVSPGHPAHLRLRATIEGSFPIQLEQHGDETVAQVNVQP